MQKQQLAKLLHKLKRTSQLSNAVAKKALDEAIALHHKHGNNKAKQIAVKLELIHKQINNQTCLINPSSYQLLTALIGYFKEQAK